MSEADLSALARVRRSLVHYPSVPIVAAMCVIACIGYRGVFDGWGFLTQVIMATVGASLCAIASRRWKMLVGEAILVTVVTFFVVGMITTQWIPSGSSPADFASGLSRGWADLLSSQTPTSLQGPRSVVPFTTAWVATALAQELDRRVRLSGIALVGVLVGLVATSLFSTEVRQLARLQGPLLIGLTIVLALLHRAEQERTGLSIASSTGGLRRRVLTPAIVLGIVMVIAAFLGPRLPLADANERFDLRDRQENPWNPLDSPSPLVTLKADLKSDDEVMFRVRSEHAINRWTVAVMASYDGVVWQVADPTTDAAAQFVPVDSVLPEPVDLGSVASAIASADIEIVGLEGHWIPHAGDPTAIRFDQAHDVRMNLATRTLALPGGLVPGDAYALESRRHPVADDISLADFIVDDRSIDLNLVPAPVLNLAAELVEGVDFGGPQVAAIRDLLTLQGFYNNGRSSPPGHSYARITAFVDNPERIVGYEEHYAATAAVLARLASIPTRVAVGYRIDQDRYVNGVAEVIADDASAWIEVNVKDVGWVPVDVTPDRSREPTEQEIGKVTRNVAVPNDPPPPPPPPQSDTDEDEDEEDEDEEDEDDEEDEEDSTRSLFAALRDRPGLVAGTVAVSPLVGFGLLALLAALLKGLRTRRRRRATTPRLQVIGAWAELVDRFEEAGHVVTPNSTPHEIVEQFANAENVAAAEPDIRTLAGLVSQSAFAPTAPTEQQVVEAWDHAEQAASVATGSLGLLERTRMRFDPRPLLRRTPGGGDE